MSIIFKELEMKNFLSYGNNRTKVSLDFNKPILITGKNFDSVIDGQIDSNGAGKTAILNGISACLYNRTIPSIEKDEMINYINGKNMEISLVFSVNNINYKIVRYRKNKALGGNGVKLYINDKDFNFMDSHDKTPDSIDNANAEIERILGFPFEIFSRIVVFSATFEPFLNLPASHRTKANQRDVIEELFGLTELTRKAEVLKVMISDTKKDLRKLKERNEQLNDERYRLIERIESTKLKKNDWESEKQSKLNSIKSEILPLSKLDIPRITEILKNIEVINGEHNSIRASINQVEHTLSAAKSENSRHDRWITSTKTQKDALVQKIERYIDVDFDELIETKNKIDVLNKDIAGMCKEITTLSNEKNTILNKIDSIELDMVTLNTNKCPYCKQDMHDIEDKLRDCKSQIVECNSDLSSIDAKISTVTSTLNDTQADLNKLMDIEIPQNVKTLQQEFNMRVSKLTDLEKSVNPYSFTDTSSTQNELATLNVSLTAISDELETSTRLLDTLTPASFGVISLVSLAKIDERVDSLATQLEALTVSVNPFAVMIDELDDMVKSIPEANTKAVDEFASDIEHQEFLLKLLTKKDSFIRKALLNKNIPFLNTRLDGYLKMLGLPHAVLFMEDMSVKISHFGTAYRHSNLSNGQKARINLALSFAFRDVLQTRYSRINLCILDECFDVALGNVGVQMAAKMIKDIAKNDKLSMFIISHKDEVSTMFNDKLEIELREGFSSIIDSKYSKTEE